MNLIRMRIASVKMCLMKQQNDLTNFHFKLKYNTLLTKMLTDGGQIVILIVDETSITTDRYTKSWKVIQASSTSLYESH